MANGVNLGGFALAVIVRAPLHPITRAGDPVAGLPEVGRAGLIGDSGKHPLLLAAFDGPKRVAAELEVVSLMIDRPTTIAIDEDAIVDSGDEVVQRDLGLS